MKNQKELIIRLFYIEHLKVKDISNKISTSSAYITKIIKQDSRYIKEKQDRKNISKYHRKIAQNQFMKEKREQERIDDNYSVIQAQHIQATCELSKTKHLSDENYRKWNASAYQYNTLKKRYEFDKQLGRSFDVPKYIKER